MVNSRRDSTIFAPFLCHLCALLVLGLLSADWASLRSAGDLQATCRRLAGSPSERHKFGHKRPEIRATLARVESRKFGQTLARE